MIHSRTENPRRRVFIPYLLYTPSPDVAKKWYNTNMFIALLGRLPALSIAEIERAFGNASWFSASCAEFTSSSTPDIQRLGGSQKLGKIILRIPSKDTSKVSSHIIDHYTRAWAGSTQKITLGISAYDSSLRPQDLQRIALTLKTSMKKSGVSMRVLPNQEKALSTATSHHNKLGLSPHKVELLIVQNAHTTIVAESLGAQNITALAARDQGRPKRDAFVGMLPPKLAQIMINLGAGTLPRTTDTRLLDPFCGTGVVLQEALLQGMTAYGTDLSEKMIAYTHENLSWIQKGLTQGPDFSLAAGDAMSFTWTQPISTVVAETYLGQPFSAPPTPAKLQEVQRNCLYIITSFLKNLHSQLEPGTSLCIAVPAWRTKENTIAFLGLDEKLSSLGYQRLELSAVRHEQLLYYRPEQVVAREIFLLTRVG